MKVRYKLIDKIHMNSGQKVIDLGSKTLSRYNYKPIHGDSFYRNAAIVSFGEKKDLTLRWNKSPLRPHINPLAIEFNPGKWNDIEEVESALSGFVDPEEATIDRLDLAVDIQEALKDVLAGLRVKHKQWSEEINSKQRKRGQITGFYYGRKPNLICIYDKAYQLKTLRTATKIQGAEEGICTRIETRLFGKAVPTQKLNDLSDYLHKNPFENIEFYHFPEEMRTINGQKFMERAKHVGFHDAYFEFNKEGNFKRTIGKQLGERPISYQLHEVFREELRSFLKLPLSKVEKSSREA